MSPPLTAMQMRMISIIRVEALAAGYGWLFEALVTNAYAESLLNPEATGDGGRSVGLFQLHEDGAGRGMSREERCDPALNTRRILQVVAGPDGNGLRRMRSTADIADLTAEFAHAIERCAACGYQGGDAELHRRRALAWQLFPLPHPNPPGVEPGI